MKLNKESKQPIVARSEKLQIMYCSADYFSDIAVTIANELSQLCTLGFIYECQIKKFDDVKTNSFFHFLHKTIKTFVIKRKGRRRSLINLYYDSILFWKIVVSNPGVLILETVAGPYFVFYFLILKILGFKIVLMLHDVVPHSEFGHWVDEWIKKIQIRFADQIVTFSKNQNDMLFEIYKREGHSIKLPYKDYYERTYSNISIQREENTILFFGTIRPNKGLETLIQAVEIIHNSVPNINLIIAGQCSDFSRYEALIKTSSIYELHIERIHDDVVGAFFLRSQLLVLPYHDATQSGPPLIAYGFGCPVIATKVGGISEYIVDEKTGLLCEKDNPLDLAEKICVLLNDRVRLKRMQEEVTHYVREEYDARKIASKLYSIINDIDA